MSVTNDSEKSAIVGQVRIDESVSRLVARLEPGEIAVIEVADLDRSTALSLLSGRPAAVLNAAPSTTGRKSSLGASLLVEGGVPVVDDLGADVMTLSEGERIRLAGESVYRGDTMVAQGTRRTPDELRQEMREGRGRLHSHVEAFAHTVTAVWDQESAQYLDGEGLPPVPELKGRTVIVVGEGLDVDKQLRTLKAFRKDFSAYLIASGSVVDLVARVLRMPDMIIGDISTTPEKLLRKGVPIVLLERPDGRTLGGDRADTLGLDYHLISTVADARSMGVLVSDRAGAEQIVTVGDAPGIEGSLDQPPTEAAAAFFIDTGARQKLVSAQMAKLMYRPGISGWLVGGLLAAALIALVVAVLFSPVGGAAGLDLWQWITNFGAGSEGGDASALFFGSPTWTGLL